MEKANRKPESFKHQPFRDIKIGFENGISEVADHNLIKLIFFKREGGMHIIGDEVRLIDNGNILLYNGRLPHCWDGECAEDREICQIQFNADVFGQYFLNLPSNYLIKKLIQSSERGVITLNAVSGKTEVLINRIYDNPESNKVILLIRVLDELSKAEYKYVASERFVRALHHFNKDRLDLMYSYAVRNFKRDVSIDEISSVLTLSRNSFCRYFKDKHSKTYTYFMNELRVIHACSLLSKTPLHINQVYSESGFRNLASFYKHFKMITGLNPLVYKKSIKQNTGHSLQ